MSQHAAKRGHPPGQSPKTSELTGLHALPAYMPDSLADACRGGLRRQEGADSGACDALLIWHAFACLVSLSGSLRHVETPIEYTLTSTWSCIPGTQDSLEMSCLREQQPVTPAPELRLCPPDSWG